MSVDVVEQVTELRKLEDQVKTRRATAEANLAMVKQRLDQTEAEIRALGVEPDNAEQELATLEAQLAKAVAELGTKLREELASCDAVIKVTTEALR